MTDPESDSDRESVTRTLAAALPSPSLSRAVTVTVPVASGTLGQCYITPLGFYITPWLCNTLEVLHISVIYHVIRRQVGVI